jgi:hypothetical protein
MTNKMPEPPRYVWPASATASTRTAARAARPDWDRGGVMSGTVYLLHFGRAYVSANGWAWPSTYVGNPESSRFLKGLWGRTQGWSFLLGGFGCPGSGTGGLGWLRAAVPGEGPEDGFDLVVSWAVGWLAFL